MIRNSRLVLFLLFATSFVTSPLFAAAPQAKEDKDGVTVTVDGKPFARFLNKSGSKPIIWPIVGPTGKEMTRGYPMRDALPSEKEDHNHHRSFWFTHGDVNGISFWHEDEKYGKCGIVEQRHLSVKQNKRGVRIHTANDWIGPDGKKQCEDRSIYHFGSGKNHRWIDAILTVTASNGTVKFGDTKEGCFGVRVAGTMRTEQEGGGTITNSLGQHNEEAWGQPAPWVDYTGPVDGETVGVAIFNHPKSFRFPSYWHVRTYGLFTANPFGLHDFKDDESADGSKTLEQGESFTLRYRVLFHAGTTEEAKIAEAYEKYVGHVAK